MSLKKYEMQFLLKTNATKDKPYNEFDTEQFLIRITF